MSESPDWRVSIAALLDLMAIQQTAISDATQMAYALRNTLKEIDPNFEETFVKNYTAIAQQLSDANHVTQHLLEKIAGQLRGDPNWRE